MIHHYLTHAIPPLQILDLGYLQTQSTANATPRKNSARAHPVTLAIFGTENTSREGRTRSRSEETIRPMQGGRERKIKNTKGPTLVKAKGNAASDIAWRRIPIERGIHTQSRNVQKHEAAYSEVSRSAAISSLRRKRLSRTTLDTETSGRYAQERGQIEVEQEKDFPFK